MTNYSKGPDELSGLKHARHGTISASPQYGLKKMIYNFWDIIQNITVSPSSPLHQPFPLFPFFFVTIPLSSPLQTPPTVGVWGRWKEPGEARSQEPGEDCRHPGAGWLHLTRGGQQVTFLAIKPLLPSLANMISLPWDSKDGNHAILTVSSNPDFLDRWG